MRKTVPPKNDSFRDLDQKISRSHHPNPPLHKLRVHPPHRPLNINRPASIPNHHRLQPSPPSIERRKPDAKVIGEPRQYPPPQPALPAISGQPRRSSAVILKKRRV